MVLLLVLLAVAFPEMAPQALLGILWTGAGALMILLPPEVRVPRTWLWLAAGFVGFSALGFLPREWFHVSPWRMELEALGLETGRHAFLQPMLAVEALSGFAATALVVMFLLGHRIDSRYHHRLTLGFAIGVGLWTLAALLKHEPKDVFGFFPNRNHTACLLAMGTLAGLGSLAQAIRQKDALKIGLSALPMIVCVYAVHAVSESRAGVVLVIAGFVVWCLLIGLRHFRGNVGKALILILIAASGTFLIVDSTAKKRLAATVEQLAPPEAPPAGDVPPADNPFTVASAPQADPPMDARIAIFQDTWSMARQENWTGVGPGQFSFVFPQYREKTNASNDAQCLHPESDWLMMLAETGSPATLCLIAGVIAVFVSAARQTRRGRAKFLRMGSLVAALLLCLHGIFDVPGHRIGLAWAAGLLLAISFRPDAGNGSGAVPALSPMGQHGWRAIGLILSLAGLSLIYTQWRQTPLLPSVQAHQQMIEAKQLYDQDQAAYEKAKAEGRDYQPDPAEDPLETALIRVGQAIGISPLDPYRHFVRGALALHYDDKQEIATRAFAIQRRLVPTRVNLPMEQAKAWIVQNPAQTLDLWKEGLRRAAAEEARFPKSQNGTVNTYRNALQAAGKDEALATAALELAAGRPDLLMLWSNSAPAGLLDREMPRLLTPSADTKDREALFQIWRKRGSKEISANFARAHPELGLPEK